MNLPDNDLSRRNFVGASVAAAAATGASQPVQAAGSSRRARSKTPQIFATGGGFFAQAWEKSIFPEYLLALSPSKSPRICWLGPASGESAQDFEIFARGMEKHDCQVNHFNLYLPATMDFVDYLLGMDIVYVGGGSTKNLMALWREWKFDEALRAAWQEGVVMSGTSAGMICWFQSGLTDSFPQVLNPVQATGILSGSANPHYNIRPDRKSRYRQLIADGSMHSPGLALDQDVGVLFRGTELVEIVSARKSAGAFRLTRTSTGYDETPLSVRYLGV